MPNVAKKPLLAASLTAVLLFGASGVPVAARAAAQDRANPDGARMHLPQAPSDAPGGHGPHGPRKAKLTAVLETTTARTARAARQSAALV